jgi:carboxylate-amine ligase
MGAVGRAIAVENCWRARRYGVHCRFVTRDGAVAVADFLDLVLDMTASDADMLGCGEQMAHCRRLAAEGSAADVMRGLFHGRQGGGDGLAEAIRWIAAATLGHH